jgi:hypothetical protein
MPLPLVVRFSNGTSGVTTVAAVGRSNAFTMKLPQTPERLELDPLLWVLSDKTSIEKR